MQVIQERSPTSVAAAVAAEPRTYSLVWEEMAWCEGWNVRCDQTQSMMREEPFKTERQAQEFLDELEAEA